MAKILITAVHEGWQESLCRTGHEFFCIKSAERKNGWKNSERKMPNNLKEVSEDILLDSIAFHDFLQKMDFIITNTIEQREFGLKVKRSNTKIKWIEMYHCFPYITWTEKQILSIKHFCEFGKIDKFVFATKQSAEKWMFSLEDEKVEICSHTVVGFPSMSYEGINNKVLSVAYDFRERANLLGYDEWKQIVNGFNWLHVGNEDFAILATKSELCNSYYKNSALFLNTAHHSPIPTSLLEAMCIGMPTLNVSTDTNRDIFKGYEDYFLYDDIFDAKIKISKIISDKNYREECSMLSHYIFQEKFSKERFINNWKEIFS